MKQGPFEVLVCPAGKPNSPFEETVIDGKTFLHAEPGEYVVVVRVIAGREHEVDGKLLSAKVIIDGIDDRTYIRLTEVFSAARSVTFRYFLTAQKRIHYHFTTPVTVPDAAEENKLLGTMQVIIHECSLWAKKGNTFAEPLDHLPTHAVAKAKHSWQQPSLITERGSHEDARDLQLQTFYRQDGVVAEMELCYHTSRVIAKLEPVKQGKQDKLHKANKKHGHDEDDKKKHKKHRRQ